MKGENRKLGEGCMSALMAGGRIASDNYYANILTGIRLYKEFGANPNEANGKALYLAAEGDRYGQITERLLKFGADPNHSFYYPKSVGEKYGGIQPLGVVNFDASMKRLLQYGANPNVYFAFNSNETPKPVNHVTPLMRTVIVPALHRLAPILLSNNANPDMKCPENGMTALHYAAQYNFDDMVVMLLKGKADKNRKDNFGRTPLQLARKFKSARSVKALSGKT
jgi:hypothetical protein